MSVFVVSPKEYEISLEKLSEPKTSDSNRSLIFVIGHDKKDRTTLSGIIKDLEECLKQELAKFSFSDLFIKSAKPIRSITELCISDIIRKPLSRIDSKCSALFEKLFEKTNLLKQILAIDTFMVFLNSSPFINLKILLYESQRFFRLGAFCRRYLWHYCFNSYPNG